MNNKRFQTEIIIDPKTGIKMVGIDDGKGETKKERKFKLYKVIAPLVVVGGIGAIIIASVKNANACYARNNTRFKYNDTIEKTFEDTIINDKTMSQLISQSEYDEFVKYRELLQVLNKIESINLKDAKIYNMSYDDITTEYIDQLYDDYYKYYPTHDENFYKTCDQLKSVEYSTLLI